MEKEEFLFSRKTIIIILALFGALVTSIWVEDNRSSNKIQNPKPVLAFSQVPVDDPKTRYFSEYPTVTYIDEKPFGSLDLVEDINVYGAKHKRKPNQEDYGVFSRLEKEARERGLLKD